MHKIFLGIAVVNLLGAAANAIWITNPVNFIVMTMCLVAAGVNFWCYRDSKEFLAKSAKKVR